MKYAHIVGWGKSVPKRVMTNHDLRALVDTSDEWIREHTGIGARRIAGDDETTATLATEAAMQALDVAGISPAAVDLIIVATATPEHGLASTACLVQDAIGADKAGAYDLAAACSGFVYALQAGADTIKAGSAQVVVVIGAETFSRILNWKDRNTCVLFGDGAGAVVLQGSDQPGGVLSTILRADGSGQELLYVPAGGSRYPVDTAALAKADNTVHMNGREVYKFATRVVDKTVRDLMHKIGWTSGQVAMLIPHQANMRIIQSAVKNLGLPMEKVYTNLEHYGNTSAASIPIALAEAADAGKLHANDKLILIGFGAGLTWAAAALTWGQPRPVSRGRHAAQRVQYGLAGLRSRVRKGLRSAGDRLWGTVSPDLRPSPGRKAPVQRPVREKPADAPPPVIDAPVKEPIAAVTAPEPAQPAKNGKHP
jgi:3-oxoacyl-[acyl-carrier-protein] synthase III